MSNSECPGHSWTSFLEIEHKITKHAQTDRREEKDTQVKQHPFLVAVPIQPKQDMTKRTTPTPINKYMNLQTANLLDDIINLLKNH